MMTFCHYEGSIYDFNLVGSHNCPSDNSA